MTAHVPTKTIVITGSVKGIGYGLAQAFLERGQNVVISGRRQEALETALQTLSARWPQAAGCLCDVSRLEDHEQLFAFAKARFGRVDIWMNNAGVSLPRKPFWEQPVEAARGAVESNLLGVLYGSRVAICHMLEQGGGQVYNMEGFGSNGRMAPGLAVYGSTKSAVTYFTQSLALELKGKPVQACLLSPGIVVTDLLLRDYEDAPEEFARARRILNLLADQVETVAPYLAERILANPQGKKVEWLTTSKVLLRFLSAPFHKRTVLP